MRENLKIALIIIAAVVAVWAIITGLQWGFYQQEVITSIPCNIPEVPVTYTDYNHNNTVVHTNISFCDWYGPAYARSTRYYTLAEILGMQRDWVIGIGKYVAEQPGNFAGWVGQHKVV